MKKVLVDIYSCNFSPLVPAVAETMTPIYSGSIWDTFTSCRTEANGTTAECLARMETICRQSKHRVTKVVRLTVDNLETVLERVPTLKAIHLLRDPRAIINSRITTNWYTLHEAQYDGGAELSREAEDLCRRMSYDLDASVALKKKFSDRFSLVMFEDLNTDLEKKSYILYNYLGISTTDLQEKLKNMTAILKDEHTVTSTSGNFTNWWRNTLSFMSIQVVQDKCKDVFHRLGYRIFQNPEEVLNPSISAYTFPDTLLLENIKRTDYSNIPVNIGVQ